MRKQQQYYILKFLSDRLLKPLDITIEEARRNGELVSVGSNQIIRIIKNGDVDTSYIQQLLKSKRKATNSMENRQSVISLQKQIDDLLFVPEYISVVVKKKGHYEKLIKKGFVVNGHKYVRLLCGAGNARTNTVIFIDESIEKSLKDKMNNGRNLEQQLVDGKFNAYFSLVSSATLPVSTPRVLVIPDCIIKRHELVDYIDSDNNIEEKNIELEFNLFDGQGLISPTFAQQWANDLELDYFPSAFCIRNAFIKGMCCVVDFHKFADTVGRHIIKDIWGYSLQIQDVDVVLTQSQFKLWSGYSSWQDYENACEKNGMQWGVTKVTPKQEYNHMFLNYQFIQVLNLNPAQIESLCKKTIDWLKGIINNIDDCALLYLLGSLCNDDIEFNHINDKITKSLIINPSIINDSYVRKYLHRSLERRIRNSFIGKLLVDGNFQVAISDPVAMLQHLFGLPVEGCLQRGEYYSKYWLDKNVDKIACMRAPLTWTSEANTVNVAKEQDWFEYLNSGIVFSIHGVDCMLHADSDFDFDIIASTNHTDIVNNTYGGLPITYDKKSAPKNKIDDARLWKADLLSFDSKIGFITNLSTTMYSMLPLFHKDSPEYKELIRRLKLCRMHQGNQIDKTKGIEIGELPNWNYKNGEWDQLVINKRPYFMRWLYPNYNKDYLKYIKQCEGYAQEALDSSIDDYKLTEDYSKYNPLIDSDCVMNHVAHYMESVDFQLKNMVKSSEFDYNILVNKNIQLDNKLLQKMQILYQQFIKDKKNYKDSYINGEKFSNYDQYCAYIRQKSREISSNSSEISNLAAEIVYNLKKSDKDFLWRVCNEGLLENIYSNTSGKYYVPKIDAEGDIEYLESKYSMQEIDISDYF